MKVPIAAAVTGLALSAAVASSSTPGKPAAAELPKTLAAAGAPNLQVGSLSNRSAPSSSGWLKVSALVRNSGTKSARPFHVGYYLSRDRRLDRRDVRLGRSRISKRLAPGRRVRDSAKLMVPASLPPGSYRLIACADDRKRMRESGERDNCRPSRTKVSIGAAGGGPAPGQPGPTPEPSPGPGQQPGPDTTPPDTEITAGPSGSVQSSSATLEFRSTEGGSTFGCRLDAGSFAACSSPMALSNLSLGPHTFEVRATDAAGNADPTPASRAWTVEQPPPPEVGPKDDPAPDPAAKALPVEPTVATSFADSTSFLYTGADPIQKEVAPGAIREQHVAVLRGRVTHRMGGPIAGVRVTVLDRPELGRTSTREDGGFDLAVNGGGPLTLRFERAGWLPAQRRVEAPWRDFVTVDDVVLVPFDGAVTEIDLGSSAAIQVARASEVTDGDGTRRATLLFSQGTDAEMVMPDGSTQPLTELSVRATEYTIGDSGRAAMPAELPPNSGYTYAAELSVDEAIEAGASEVRFDDPVINYLENFLDFPAGTAVPTGYYDRERGRWVASPNGRVVEILSESEGRADVDIDGDRAADGADALAALGVANAERERLAALYEPGQSLWRVPIDHFSPVDHNWPWGPPMDAIPPSVPVPEPAGGPRPKKERCWPGSIIGCQTQRLGQSLDVPGAPFSLHYWSDRTPGRAEDRALQIPLSGASVPPSLQEILLRITVAGRQFSNSFSPAPNQSHRFVWDGRDAYGRTPQGAQPVTITIGYRYGLVRYSSPVDLQATFGRLGLSPIDGARGRMDLVVWREFRDEVEATIGTWDARGQALGGWTLDGHHALDPARRTVHLGAGGALSADPVITAVAGTGQSGFSGDGGPAKNATLADARDVVLAPDGTFYLSDAENDVVRRVSPDGTISSIGHNPSGPKAFNRPTGLGLGSDGSVYVASALGDVVKRIAPNGSITTVAGGGSSTDEDVPATEARLGRPTDVAEGPDGSLYIVEPGGNRVRQVGTDGRIVTVAGGGNPPDGVGDGGPATQARLDLPLYVAVGPGGELFISEGSGGRVRRVDASGRITTVAGGGDPSGDIGDGGPATSAYLFAPAGMDVAPDGSLYVATTGHRRVRRVAPDGVITTVAGGGKSTDDAGPATAANVWDAKGVAAAPDGSFYIATEHLAGGGQAHRVARPLPSGPSGEVIVPSGDGSEAYEFSAEGRHVRTRDGLTGALRRRFQYDASGRLVSIEDGDGNVTTIQRAADGEPQAILAPGGQRTTLQQNADGYLTRIANPAGEATTATYTADGLMTSLTDPRGGVHRFEYTAAGRLTRDEDPETGVQALARTDTDDGYRVTKTTALGRSTTFSVERRPEGGLQLETTEPTGARTTVVSRPDGTQTATYPNGLQVDLERGPDPRWDMAAPILTSLRQKTPAGVTEVTTYERQATLSDPRDPFSVTSLSDKLTVNGRATTGTYDPATRTATSTSPAGRTSRSVLDGKGRVARVEPGAGLDPIVFTYDARGRVSRAEEGAHSWSYEYDALNRVVARIDAAAKRTEYAYDGADRLTELRRPSGRLYRFGYDANGNLTSLTMPDGDVHELAHNGVDQLARFKPSGSGASQTWAYDRDHGLADLTLPGGRVIEHARDSGARPTGQSYDEATASFSYADQSARVSAIERSPAGGGTVQRLALGYDADLPTRAVSSGVAGGQFDYSYDENFFLEQVKLTSGLTVLDTALARDSDGFVTALGPFALDRSGPGGAVSQIGDGTLDLDYAYDGLGRLATRTQQVGSSQRYRAELTRDARGRITRKVETVAGSTATFDYTYDDDGQLLRVERDGTAVEQYTYDQNGNRTSRQLEALTYDAQERLATRGGIAYSFHADGFLATRGTDSFDYSARGELLEATVGGETIRYAYDGLARRVSRTDSVGTAQYLYGNPGDPFQVTAVRDSVGQLSSYYYDEEGHLFAMQRGADRYYIATDQVGTPRVVTDGSGSVVKSLTYDSFGNLTSDSAPAFELPFGFAGGLADGVTGLLRFGFRDYEPASGRWTARDPVLFRGGQSNLYAYVGNNPASQRDPTGLFCVGGSVYAGYGAGAQVCATDEGLSVCVETGFGFGKDLGAGTGELAEDGQSIAAEVEASFGPASVSAGVQLDNKGCLSFQNPQFEVADLAKVTYNSEDGVNVGIEPDVEVDAATEFKLGKVEVQAKLVARICRKFAG